MAGKQREKSHMVKDDTVSFDKNVKNSAALDKYVSVLLGEKDDANALTSSIPMSLTPHSPLHNVSSGIRKRKKRTKKKKVGKTEEKNSDTNSIGGDIRPKKHVEVVVYKSNEKKRKSLSKVDPKLEFNPISDDSTSQTQPSVKAPSLNQLRHEVQLFGIQGFKKETKAELMEKVIIKLGAKPPKREYINYKDLIEKRKQEKKDNLGKRQLDRAFGFDVKKSSSSSAGKRPSPFSVPIHGGTLGVYHNGLQVINKKHIKKFNRNK